jgi:iron complex outermembrane receptor protein
MNFERRRVAVALASAFGVGSVLVAGVVDAQDVRVNVTGSNIKRIEGEGAVPVQVLTRDDIDRTGVTSAIELLNYVSANNSQGGNFAAGSTGTLTFSQNSASLRGLGAQHTLVLINGVRVSTFAGTYQGVAGVNLDSIPLSAVERVEILKDGASAIYGSDAIAGVINFIMRQNYSGIEATAYGAWPTRSGDGDQWQGKAAVGYGDLTKDKFNVMLAGSYVKQNELFLKDRNFATGFKPDIGLDTTSGSTFPGYISTIGTSLNFPACNTTYNNVNNGVRCRFDPSSVAQAIPQNEQTTAYGSFRYQVNPDWQAFLTGTYSNAVNKVHIQPVPLADQFFLPAGNPLYFLPPYYQPQSGFSKNTFLLQPSSPYYPHALAAANDVDGEPLNIRYRAVENGDRQFTDTNSQYGFNAGLKGSWKNWDFDAVGWWNQSKAKEETTGGYPQLTKILPLLNSGVVNPFGPNTPAVHDLIVGANFNGEAFNSTATSYGGEIKGAGEVYKLPAGSMSLALGGQAWKEEFDQNFNTLLQQGDVSGYGGNNKNVNDKSRTIYALFGELSIPIIKNLEANAAVRYDHYSDFGSTTNPKFSVRYLPVKELLIRASWGTGFLAPNLYQLNTPATESVTQAGLSDPLRCPTTGDSNDCSTQFRDTFGGNPNLQPETSQQTNVGIVLEPMAGLSLGVDWFKVNLYNYIGNGPTPSLILSNLDQFGFLVTRGPVQPQYPTLPGPIASIAQAYINQGTYKVQGYDVDLRYTLPQTPIGLFKFQVSGTYYTKFDQQYPDGSYVGTISSACTTLFAVNGIAPRWKSYSTLNWSYGGWGATLGNLYSSGYQDALNTDGEGDCNTARRVVSLSLWDLQATYTGFKNTTLTVGVKNLFDTNPPLTNQGYSFQTGYDPAQYNALARVIYASISYKFDWPKK